jgi:hypothetical protein
VNGFFFAFFMLVGGVSGERKKLTRFTPTPRKTEKSQQLLLFFYSRREIHNEGIQPAGKENPRKSRNRL